MPLIMSNSEIKKLEKQKIDARKKLQQLSPKIAQNIVNQTLYPEYWEMDFSNHSWEESIPINYSYEKIDT